MYFVSQQKENDCGFTCLKMILASLNHNKDFLYLPVSKEDAYSFYELIELGAQYKLTLGGYLFSDKDSLITSFKGPMILEVNIDGNTHAIILEKLNKRRAKIIDPSLGEYHIKSGDLFSMWDGKALVVESYLKYEGKLEIEKIKVKRGSFDLIILKSISTLSLFIGLSFINNSHFLLPLSFLALCAVSEILYRMSVIKKMKAYDKYFTSKLTRPLENIEELKVYEDYKSDSLSLPISFIFSLVICIFLIFLCAYNSFYNLIFVIALILFSLLDKLVLNRNLLLSKEVERKENNLFTDNGVPFNEKLDSLHSLSYKYAYRNNITKYVELFFTLLLILLSMYLEHILSLTYVLFYFALSLYFKENLDKVFSLDESIKKYRLEKARYSSLMSRG
ncbi:MAG: cysteine peptidase family C39 domain-containing protein [Coprobacillus sp.]|nr:cysteine peptidase family C39 domain-containing protein [Coprobacillus sp.]